MILLSFADTEKILQTYHLPFVTTKAVRTKREANQFIRKIGFPIVLKVYSPSLAHRTEKGAVFPNIYNSSDFRKAWGQLSPWLKKSLQAKILIQPKKEGLELAMGMKRDAQFGPVIMFGLGGIFIEIFHDVSFRLAPFSKAVAKKMIQEIQAYPLLNGFRGEEKVDIEALASILVNLSKLSLEHSEIQEIDFNPVMAKGKQIFIVDAKFFGYEES